MATFVICYRLQRWKLTEKLLVGVGAVDVGSVQQQRRRQLRRSRHHRERILVTHRVGAVVAKAESHGAEALGAGLEALQHVCMSCIMRAAMSGTDMQAGALIVSSERPSVPHSVFRSVPEARLW